MQIVRSHVGVAARDGVLEGATVIR